MKGKKSRLKLFSFLLGWFLLLIFPISLFADGKLIRTQGLINPGGNLKGNYLLINEMRVYIHRSTEVMDLHGTVIPVTELKPKKWVYMEIEKDPDKNVAKAKKIYLLPHYVKPEEKRKFAFMK